MTTKIQGFIWLYREDRSFAGPGRIQLLEKIGEYGSISKAAKAVGMSYKGAWDSIDLMNNLAPEVLIIRVAGGKGGGGSQLTDYARQLIKAFHEFEAEHQQFLEQLNQKIENFDQLYQFMRRLNMQTSARNQFAGTVANITEGVVNAEVTLRLKGNLEIVAAITLDSVRQLGLKNGQTAIALVKSPQVVLVRADTTLKFSARNHLCGKVSNIEKGAVNIAVTIDLAGGNTLKAVITEEALVDLGVKEGEPICAIFKSSSVIIAVEE
ncbi:TOBE domain-containing protein [Beggiatoa leptomitoformis]|uniref:LysR family transcriptional regulator n=1 Tax=Beggiatoa leptomitoformis TaxID=288004 RepID=A0A2N9YBR2_9GAMM|nr:TOBE domain-containing protein [Beggiatoa leptomitoformis]ALG66741.1 LysR family transcriptional regulator [Beggiatoa leptomitoformis]AUI67920.1 LysR family transcriptional regulator [Beggiatoa leptomitoformis]